MCTAVFSSRIFGGCKESVKNKKQTIKYIFLLLLISLQWRVVAIHEILVPYVASPHGVFPRGGVFVIAVFVIKVHIFFSHVHPFYQLTRGGKS